jgi:hypothetical protein
MSNGHRDHRAAVDISVHTWGYLPDKRDKTEAAVPPLKAPGAAT